MKSLRKPLVAFITYIVITLLLHIFGPWTYKNENLTLVVIYMSLVLIFFYIGYSNVIKRNIQIEINYKSRNINYYRFYKYIIFGVYLQFFLILLILIENISSGNISLDGFNPGNNYMDAMERNRDLDFQTKSVITQIKTLLSPFFYFTNVLIIYYFSFISRKLKIVFFLFLGVQIFTNLLIKGAQKDIFDLFMIIISVLVLKTYNNRALFLQFKKFVFFGSVIVLSLFSYIQISRLVAYGQLNFYTGSEHMQLDMNNFIFDIFGFKMGLGLSILISYISQGYYGLSLSLQLPFEWTYGIGNSFALASYFDQYFGIKNGLDLTYPFRMEKEFGLDATMFWHTFFPWAASDITFPGVIILMFFIGKLYAKTILESIKYSNPLSIVMFYFLNVFLIYVPANNQLMQTREMMLGFVVILVIWMLKHKKYNNKYSN